MIYLIKKEITLFFSSGIGCAIVSLWMLTASLLLWVFSGPYNLLNGGYATLRPLFSLAPLLFLLFVPAVTMRSFAEEKRMGSMELLFFRPLRPFSIVLAKFWASLILMLIAVLPTLLYLCTLIRLSSAGVDGGEVAGGYIGLCFLLGAWVSMGLFASSVTSNQLFAFLLALLLASVSFYGFELIASLTVDGRWHNSWVALGMQAHYRSMIRGVIDSRDVLYFASISLVFLSFTVCINTRKR